MWRHSNNTSQSSASEINNSCRSPGATHGVSKLVYPRYHWCTAPSNSVLVSEQKEHILKMTRYIRSMPLSNYMRITQWSAVWIIALMCLLSQKNTSIKFERLREIFQELSCGQAAPDEDSHNEEYRSNVGVMLDILVWKKPNVMLTDCGLVTPYGNIYGSTLAQVMACCMAASSHYLNQCLLVIKKSHGIHLSALSLDGYADLHLNNELNPVGIKSIQEGLDQSNFQGSNLKTSLWQKLVK